MNIDELKHYLHEQFNTLTPRQAEALALFEKRALARTLGREALLDKDVDLEKLRRAVDAGFSADAVVEGTTAAHVAVMRGSLDALRMFDEEWMDTEIADPEGFSLLDLAYRHGHKHIIEFLSEPGRDAPRYIYRDDRNPVANYGTKPFRANGHLAHRLMVSVSENRPFDCLLALAEGADPNVIDESFKQRPLDLAAARCDPGMVKILISGGAVVDSETMQAFWTARPGRILSDEWYQTYDLIAAAAPSDLFPMSPYCLTMDDLRMQKTEGVSWLQYFSIAGMFDIVLDTLKKNPDDRLTARDLLTKNASGTSPLRSVIMSPKAADIFTPEIWQGRMDELLEVWAHVPDFPFKQKFPIEELKEKVGHIRVQRVREQSRRKNWSLERKPE